MSFYFLVILIMHTVPLAFLDVRAYKVRGTYIIEGSIVVLLS